MPKFGLDIAVFPEDVGPPQPLFVEVKSYGGKRQGGVGFGNGRGEGPQVDLLVGDASALFDSYIRWAFVDATQPVGVESGDIVYNHTPTNGYFRGGVE